MPAAVALLQPHLFVVTVQDVEAGHEFLLDYEKSYWQTIAKEKKRCQISEVWSSSGVH